LNTSFQFPLNQMFYGPLQENEFESKSETIIILNNELISALSKSIDEHVLKKSIKQKKGVIIQL